MALQSQLACSDCGLSGYRGLHVLRCLGMHTDAFLKMKIERAAEWGDQPSEHPRIVEEWYRGSKTGASACTACGREVTIDDEEAR